MLLSLGVMVGGFMLLISGAKHLMSGSTDLVIGLSIVSFGTLAPESVVNLVASLQGHSDTVYGNVVGSNNLNLFFILGVAGLILQIAEEV
ncbi:hypothetical protein [Lewinella sp. IMCC34191]|uniref:hypothetical protein n=1 Tax=Lewinella sp. IMCC34191 TaxID=2259172 RepID=UPI000E27AC3A|nr:hypothetical protein [Lewinella sp. IMCC34191]